MFHPLKVSKIVKETESAVSILFELTGAQKDAFSFKSGQFLTIKKDIKGQDVRRSYSLCSTPKSGELKVAVKKIEGGLFSSFALDELSEGDVLEVGIPAGKFTIDCERNNKNKYVFIAAGSGITPTISMIKSVLTDEPLSSVFLLYGNKTISETIFYEEIEILKEVHGDRLNVRYFLSKEAGQSPITSGRISSDKIDQIEEEWGGVASIDGFYMCGPGLLIEEIKNALVNKGITEDKIHFELFTNISKEDKSSDLNEDFEVSKVTVAIDDVDYTFEVKAGKEILAAGLAAGIDIPYSCQGGVCGSCECTVKSGKVEMNQNMILSEEEVEDGQALACQAVAKTSEVTLSFDY